MKETWLRTDFENCLEKVTYTNKIPSKDFKPTGQFPIVSQEKDYISGYWDNSEDLFKGDSPVVIFGDHTRVIKYIDFNFVLGADGVKILKPKPSIHPKYLYYYLLNANIVSLGYSRHYRLLKKTKISYPDSLAEQQSIVAILDEVFAAIDQAKANTERNLKNAKELYESYRKATFSINTWSAHFLSDISENLDSKRKPITKNKRTEGSTPYYGASGIVDFVEGYIFDEPLLCISEDGANLLARTYPIAFPIQGKTWVNNHAHVLRFNNIHTQDYVEEYLNSISLQLFVSGMAQPKLNQSMLNKIPIPLPPESEQRAIVRKLDDLRAETQKMEVLYQKKLTDLDELKKSILQKAFTGELITASLSEV